MQATLKKHVTTSRRVTPRSRRKSWVEKRDSGKNPQIKILEADFADIRRGERMLIPTPEMVDAYIRTIPKGKQSDIGTMRRDLAIESGADKTCPITSGIFLRISAEAAWEEHQAGRPVSRITPFWRIISKDSPTAVKLTCGVRWIVQQRKREKLTDV